MDARFGQRPGCRPRTCRHCGRLLGRLSGPIRLKGGDFYCPDRHECRAVAEERIRAARGGAGSSEVNS